MPKYMSELHLSRVSAERARLALIVVAAVIGLSASPSEGQELSPAVDAHLSEIMELAQTHSVNRYRIDWATVRSEVLAHASGAQTIGEAEAAILRLLEMLEDGHSFYQWTAEDQRVNQFTLPEAFPGRRELKQRGRLSAASPCTVMAVITPEIPALIGYVRVPGSANLPREDLELIQQQIHREDRGDLLGWIVDLRGNRGGNMWPMLQGIGPILSDGVAGYFVSPDGARQAWGYWDGKALLEGDPPIDLGRGTSLRRPAQRIAVLTDQATVSAGEAIAVAFRARPAARSFGAPTCGRSSVNRPFRLGNGAVLFLTVGILADRAGRLYGGRIPPDERANGEDAVLRAIEWILETSR